MTTATATEIMGRRGRELVRELYHRLDAVRDGIWADEEWAQTPEEGGRLWLALWELKAMRAELDTERLLDVALDRVEGDPARVTWEVFARQLIDELDGQLEALRRVREALAAPGAKENA